MEAPSDESGPANGEFQRAFTTMSYFFGRREAELLAPLGAIHPDAQALARLLSNPERERRAQVLARELTRLSGALAARTVK